ncbi:GHKL domain-containing protein [candidate division GN15 bacterium]|nr:GHKL domain-containing protein [candidate division GN15 bacterium]
MAGLTATPLAATVHYEVERLEDPRSLPYRFEVLGLRVGGLITMWGVESDFVIMNIDGDSIPDFCHIQHNWTTSDTLTAAVFTTGGLTGRTLEHFNFTTPRLSSYRVFDYNRDGLDELLAAYAFHDSIWVEIIHPTGGSRYRRLIATGDDLDGSGAFDGQGIVCRPVDVTGDGIEELLVSTEVGYDLYPRVVQCIDWTRDTLLWRFEHAGSVSSESVRWLETPDDTLFVISIASKGNKAKANGMTDLHAYLVALRPNGAELWRRRMGPTYSSPRVTLFDVTGDRHPEIVALTHDDTSAPASESDDPVASLVALTSDGSIVHERRFDGSSVRDVQLLTGYDGARFLAVTLSDVTIHALGSGFTSLAICSFYSMPRVAACDRYLPGPGHQYLVSTADGNTWLLNDEFSPLAQFPNALVNITTARHPLLAGDSIRSIKASNQFQRVSSFYTFVPNPWYTIFFRRPILAFLAGAIPLGGIALVIWAVLLAFRRKNRLISSQRDSLDRALVQLRETQQQLIAAEKFRQARDIAGGFAHEIRNALFPARSWIGLLDKSLSKADATGADRDRQSLERINSSIDRAVALTELISRYTKLEHEAAQAVEAPVAAILSEVLASNQIRIDSLGVSVRASIPTDLRVAVAAEHLAIIFRNLLLNSLDALTDSSEDAIIEIAYERGDDRSVIIWRDTGEGIPEEHLDRIFDAFFSTKPSAGTGIGLAMTRRIVDIYNGTVSVSSAPGQGTTFRLQLPVAAGAE